MNYQCDDFPPELAKLIVADVDKSLIKSGLNITARTVARSFEFHSGHLGLTLTADSNTFQLLGNFHRSSTTADDLKNWLQTPIDEVQKAMDDLLDVLKLSIEEPQDVSNG